MSEVYVNIVTENIILSPLRNNVKSLRVISLVNTAVQMHSKNVIIPDLKI